MNGVRAEEAVVDQGVLEEGLATDIAHHVQMKRVTAHDVLLPHADGGHPSDAALRAQLAHKMASETGLLALLVPLQRDTAGEQGNFCGVLKASVVAVAQRGVQGERLAGNGCQPPDLVLVVAWFICPCRGHDEDLLSNLPIHLVFQLQGHGTWGNGRREPCPSGSVTNPKHLEDAPETHGDALGAEGVIGLGILVAASCQCDPDA
mmetsp:Transcript_139134/g.432905  ORF Transcript_139134/g.432905 Transcript_139134/m.432905 type:complete len:205 (+) Transcript_139134:3109-3723(+)